MRLKAVLLAIEITEGEGYDCESSVYSSVSISRTYSIVKPVATPARNVIKYIIVNLVVKSSDEVPKHKC